MTLRYAWTLSALSLALGSGSGAAKAGPCADHIYDVQVAVGKRLNATAAQGGTAAESTGALLHHQPTPGSVAAAEARLGELPQDEIVAIEEDMERAQEADAAGDREKCDKALADAERRLGQQR